MKKQLLVLQFSVIVLLGLGSAVAAQVQPVTLTPGSPAPELGLKKILQAPEGTKSDLASLKGKVVVLEFWATWCALCIAQQPHLNELIEKFGDKPVQFISITNEDESKVASFLRRRTLKGWVGLDTDRSVQKAYDAFGLPKAVVVDQQGRIASVLNPRDLTEILLDQLIRGTYVAPDKAKEEPIRVGNGAAPVDEAAAQLSISIKPSNSSATMTMRDNGSFIAKGADLKAILSSLLGTTVTRIYLPTALEEKRYEMEVTLPGDKTEAYKPLAVQAIQTALGVRVRRVTREVDGYVLTASKELTGSLQPSTAKTFHVTGAKGVMAASEADINQLSAAIESVLGLPVVNETGLQGKFDWDLLFDANVSDSIIDAVWKEFGLKLTPAKREVDVVVVEIQ